MTITRNSKSGGRVTPRVLCLGAVCVLLASASGCGGDTQAPGNTRPGGVQQAIARHDLAVDSALSTMHNAAVKGDRGGVAAAQRELEQLAQTDPTPAGTSTDTDPFRRVIDEIAFKRAPLFIQQIATSDGSHRVYAGVDRGAFCLLTPASRRAAVADVYLPIERRMRARRITDWQLVVVRLTSTAPTATDALAIGRRRDIRLAKGGC